jgi:uncharacterized protein with HEPN domain
MRIDELHLLDIIDAAGDIQNFLGEIEEERFLLDKLLQAAVLFKLLVIGNAAGKINQKVKDKYESMPWDDMMSFADFLHNPQGILAEKVWVAAVVDIPDIQFAARDILKSEYNK